MAKILVAYYSRSGHTRRIAREIAQATGAQMEEIREPRGRRGAGGYLRSALEALFGLQPAILPPPREMSEGDLLVIGTPVWCWTIASPVRSFVAARSGGFERVAFFCTCGGSGHARVMRELAALCGKRPVAALALTESECRVGRHREEFRGFLRDLTGLRTPPSPAGSSSDRADAAPGGATSRLSAG